MTDTKTFTTAQPLAEFDGAQGLAPLTVGDQLDPSESEDGDTTSRRRRRRKRPVVRRKLPGEAIPDFSAMTLKGGDAQTLRDYWSGHGHAGPSHGAERDAIMWGTPGDFDRCVTMVSAHMSPEQAKGYCNLRHHDALGYYPATHARMDRGKMQTAATNKVGPHGYVHGWIKVNTTGEVPVRKGEVVSARHESGTVTGLHEGSGGKGISKVRDASGVMHKIPSDSIRRAAPDEYIDHVNSSWSHADTPEKRRQHILTYGTSLPSKDIYRENVARQQGKPARSIGRETAEHALAHPDFREDMTDVDLQDTVDYLGGKKNLTDEEKELLSWSRGELSQSDSEAPKASKSARNPRDKPSGRFRQFGNEVDEAHTAIKEGRVGDAMDLIGQARTKTRDPDHSARLKALQDSLARSRSSVPDAIVKLTKVYFAG